MGKNKVDSRAPLPPSLPKPIVSVTTSGTSSPISTSPVSSPLYAPIDWKCATKSISTLDLSLKYSDGVVFAESSEGFLRERVLRRKFWPFGIFPWLFLSGLLKLKLKIQIPLLFRCGLISRMFLATFSPTRDLSYLASHIGISVKLHPKTKKCIRLDVACVLVEVNLQRSLPKQIHLQAVDERREALFRASKYAWTRGVKSVIDLGRYYPGTTDELSWKDLQDVYLWADSSKKMLIRTCLFFPITTWSRLLKGSVLSEWLYLGGVKAFSDGSLGTNSVAIHSIGDKANDMILDMYKSGAATNGDQDRRLRIEHAQQLVPGSADRFGQLQIVASVQPDHLLDDADTAPKKIGFDRAQKESYLSHSLLNGSALLAFGSDWPVSDINPLHGIRTVVKRIPPKWNHAWIPSECISFTDSVTAHTISATRGAFLDHHLGSLSSGKLADFVILTTNSWDEFSKEDSSCVSVLATYVGGKQLYP